MQLLLRPVFHRLEHRIRAHVLICWLGSCSPASPNAPEAKAGAISAARPPASSNSPLPARPRPSPRRPAATRPEGHLPGTITIHHTTATGHRLRSHLKPARRTATAWTHDHAPLSPHSRSSNTRFTGRVTTNCGTPGHSPGHVGTAGPMTTGQVPVHGACTGCGAAGLAEGSDADHSRWRPDNQPGPHGNQRSPSHLDAVNRHAGD